MVSGIDFEIMVIASLVTTKTIIATVEPCYTMVTEIDFIIMVIASLVTT